jgi:Transposase zinc-binding domain
VARLALEVADILRGHGQAWREANAGHVSLGQLKAMSAIENCRTAALGGHVVRCEDCAHEAIAYNSCLMGKSSNGELAGLGRAVVYAAASQAHHYEGRLRSAINLSDGWNAPRRKCGGTIDSMASSFSVGSPRV